MVFAQRIWALVAEELGANGHFEERHWEGHALYSLLQARCCAHMAAHT